MCLRLMVIAVVFCVYAAANTINLGYVSIDPFGSGYGVTVANLTGAESLGSDFPATDELKFLGATVTLTYWNDATFTQAIGDPGPGALQPPSLQFSDFTVFKRLVLTFTLSSGAFRLAGSTSSGPVRTDIEILMDGGPDGTLDPGDFALITTSSAAAVPEPSTAAAIAAASLFGLYRTRRRVQ